MIQFKYILKKNRQTDFYNVGKIWFGKYKITWVRWVLCKRFVLIKMEKL